MFYKQKDMNKELRDFFNPRFIEFIRWRGRYTERVRNLNDDNPYSVAIQGVLSILVFESVDQELDEIYNALIMAEIGDALVG